MVPRGKRISAHGNKSVLAIINVVSEFLVAEPIANRNAEMIVSVLTTRIIWPYGPPDEIYSDGAQEFQPIVGNITLNFWCDPQDHYRLSAPVKWTNRKGIFHSEANACDEVVVVRKCFSRWDQFLPYVIFAYNTAYHRTIRNTPFFLFYGRDPSLGTNGLEKISVSEEELIPAQQNLVLEKARSVALKYLCEENLKRKEVYDKNAKPEELQPGDIVMLNRPLNIGTSKLYPWYVGPFRVIRVIGNAVLSVAPVGYPLAKEKQIHSDRS